MKKKENNIILIIVMIVIAGIARLLPHPPNFSPILAMAMFGGTYLMNRKLAFLVPLVVIFVFDLILNNTSLGYIVNPAQFTWFSSYALWVYVPLALIVFLGMRMKNKVNIFSVIGYTLLGSIIFFLVSNFGSFIINPIYSKDLSGLIASYINGIPFYTNTLIGNLVFSTILYGVYEWVGQKRSILRLSKAT